MPSVDFADLSREDAEAYRDVVIAMDSVRLGELSGWIRSTGGPWGECDASLESLRPLWVWFYQFVSEGCPGIPVGASVQRWIGEDGDDVSPEMRIGYGLEAIASYLFLVCRRVDPAAAWSLDLDRKSTTFHRTGIGLSNGVWFVPISLLGGIFRRNPGGEGTAVAGDAVADDLVSLITTWLGDLAPGAQERGESVLPAPRATVDPPPVLWRPGSPAPAGEPAAVAPVMVRPRTADDDIFAGVFSFCDDLIILRGPAVAEDELDRLQPLDGDLVAHHLREHGFERTGERDGTQFWHLNTDEVYASASVTFAAGAARMVGGEISEPLDSRAPGFRAAATAFLTLAERLGARLTYSEEIEEELDHDDV